MRRFGLSLVLVVFAAGLLACGEETAPVRKRRGAAAEKAEMVPPPAVQMASEKPLFLPPEGYRYDPEGKSDPFRSFIRVNYADGPGAISSPLERFDLSQLSVTGIIWGRGEPRALVKDPAGKGYIVGIGTAIGFLFSFR